MFYKMLFDRFVDFAYLYTILDMPRQIRIVCLHKGAVLCFVNNGLADKTSTEPGLVANEIAPVLALLFQALLHQGRPPADWNHAFVTALFKKGDYTQASNYGPISVTH